jgi:iron complex transport system substrate-binding protein
VAFISGTAEGSYWVGNPSIFADLLYFKELGLDIVQPDITGEYFEELSWEQASKYAADLLLVDARQWSATGEQLKEQVPTFAALPAAKADAFGSWKTEYVPSYAGFTPILEELAETIRAADPDVV